MASEAKKVYTNRRWREDGGEYVLEFLCYDCYFEVLRFYQDDEEESCWIVSSEPMGLNCEYLYGVDTPEQAKEEFERQYTEYLEEQIRYYEDLMQMWEE